MEALITFFRGITDVITGVISFIIDFFGDVVYMVQLLGQIALQLPTYFAWLPSQVLSSLVLVFTLVILYKILGREG